MPVNGSYSSSSTGQQGTAVDDAARELDCGARRIWRDLKVLQEAGCPLYNGERADGRSVWNLEEQSALGLSLKLSLAETATLLMRCDLATPAMGRALGAAGTAAFDRISRVLSRDAGGHCCDFGKVKMSAPI